MLKVLNSVGFASDPHQCISKTIKKIRVTTASQKVRIIICLANTCQILVDKVINAIPSKGQTMHN